MRTTIWFRQRNFSVHSLPGARSASALRSSWSRMFPELCRFATNATLPTDRFEKASDREIVVEDDSHIMNHISTDALFDMGLY